MIETVISYINEHFKEDLPDKVLASAAGLSSYHFNSRIQTRDWLYTT